MRNLITFFSIITLVSSCSKTKNDNKDNGQVYADTITEIVTDDGIQKLVTPENLNEKNWIIGGSIGTTQILHLTPSCVFLSSDEEFNENILTVNPSVQEFQNKYHNIFQIETIKLDERFEENTAYKLKYKNSYIVVHRNIFEGVVDDKYYNIDKDNIACALIKDSEIQMSNNIHIGMNKDALFKERFGLYVLPSVDTLWCGDEMGDTGIQFIFKKDTLEKVLISSNYDFVEFNFYDKKLID